MLMLNVTQVMARLNVGKSSVYGLVRNGLLPKPIKIGGKVFRSWTGRDVERVRKFKEKFYRKGRGRKAKSKLNKDLR